MAANKYSTLFALIIFSLTLTGQDCDCTAENLDRDTTVLIRFYAAMGGQNWTINSNWTNTDSLPGAWYGISTDPLFPQCIDCLDLDGQLEFPTDLTEGCGSCLVINDNPPGNNLQLVDNSEWPNDFSLPCLRKLSLDNNEFNIPFPDFSGFTSLCELIAQKNGFFGELSTSHFNNPNLKVLNLNDNELTGTIPADLKDALPELNFLYLNKSKLSGEIPVLDGMSTYAVSGNNFTFEDILPALEVLTDSILIYRNQRPVFHHVDSTVALGLPFSLALDFDLEVPDNVYQWCLDGSPVADQTTNTLTLDSFTVAHTGTWSVRIRNPRATRDTLESFPIMLSGCTPGIREESRDVCPGQIAIIDDISFSGDSLYFPPVRARNGCDSVWRVILNFYNPLTILDTFVCEGDSIILNGQQYLPGNYEILTENTTCLIDDTLRLTVTEATVANLGAAEIADTLSCGPAFQPQGNLPPNTFGRWVLSGEAFTLDLTDPDAVITDFSPGNNPVTWVLGTEGCSAYDSITRNILQSPLFFPLADSLPPLLDDQSVFPEAAPFDVLRNDDGWQDFDLPLVLIVTDPPGRGRAWFDENNRLVYERGLGAGRDTIRYTINDDDCMLAEGEVFVLIEPRVLGANDLPPNVITPNGDGYNDVLVIPLLHHNPDAFPESVLKVFLGEELLYEITNYQCDWGGTLPDGSLPEAGTFFRYTIEYGDPRFAPHAINLKVTY